MNSQGKELNLFQWLFPFRNTAYPHEAQTSTIVTLARANIAYGLPVHPSNVGGIRGSGYAYRVHKPNKPPCITGLGPVYEGGYEDYSELYTEDSSSKNESSRDYMKRITKEALKVLNLDDRVAIKVEESVGEASTPAEGNRGSDKKWRWSRVEC